jgi:hypothetical protein
MDTDKLIIGSIVMVNALATAFVTLNNNAERETRLWQLYTASTTGLYGYALANDRTRKDDDYEKK